MILNITQTTALASAALPIAICIAAGSVMGRRDSPWPGADMLAGFGLLGSALTFLAVATPLPLSGLMIALAALSIGALAIRRQIPGGRETWIALALVSPILIRAAGIEATLWDEFWHWLPSAAYSFSHDSLAKLGLAPSFSHFPGYPQATQLMIAAASMVAGRFLEAAGPVINVALLAGVSALFADAIAAALARRGRLKAIGQPLFLVASAVAVTILLNPGLNGNVVLSSYADCATMVAVGALGLIGVDMLMDLADPDAGRAENLAWRFGFIAALLVNLKQANPVLLALVIAGLAAVALRDPVIDKRRALAQLPSMLGPAIAVFVAWRWYVMMNVPHGDVSFRPVDAWNFHLLPAVFAAAWRHITAAPLFHAMMWIVTAAGIVAFFTSPRAVSETRGLAIVCATVFIGYNVFLLAVYLGAMTSHEAETAADYWRYTPHVALLALYASVMALATGPWPAWMSLRGTAPALAAIVLALCALPVRSDLYNPGGGERAWPLFIRRAVSEMRLLMPAGSRAMIIQCWNESPFGTITSYDLWQLGAPERDIPILLPEGVAAPAAAASLAARGEADYLIIQDNERLMDAATDKLGLPRLDRELALFAWRNGAWEKVKSWPVPLALKDPARSAYKPTTSTTASQISMRRLPGGSLAAAPKAPPFNQPRPVGQGQR
jgi:hypothetical protein